jgi:hypothetical protein
VAEAAVGAVDAKAGEVVGTQRGLHVVITRAFCTKATKTRAHTFRNFGQRVLAAASDQRCGP